MATGVPQNVILPFVGVEFDSSLASVGAANMPVTALLTGQSTAAGTGTVETKYLVSSAAEVEELSGVGSMLHNEAISWFKNNNVTTAYIVMLGDAATSTAATTLVTVAGTVDKAGEWALYVDGTRYAISVTLTDTVTTIADKITAAITADTSAPVSCANVAGAATLTAKSKGIIAGDIDVRYNYNRGEVLPGSLTVTVGTTTAGTVDPDVQDILDVIGDDWFNIYINPYTDNTNLNLLEAFAATQAGPTIQKDMMIYQSVRDTRSNLITYGTDTNRNSQYVSTEAAYQRLESVYKLSAAVAAVSASSIADDPAVPLHRQTLVGISILDPNDTWNLTERNQLALSGIATLTDSLGVQTESTVTMYLKNSAGALDTAWQQQNTVFILMRLRYDFVNYIQTKYPRAKLANSTERLAPGQQVITPDVGKAEAIAWFKIEERAGLVEGLDQFKRDVQCVRNATNVNRLDWILPPDLINQFIVGSGIMQFRQEAS